MTTTTTAHASITVTIPNPTAGQLSALTDLMNGVEQNKTASDAANQKKTSKRTTPEDTVDEEEEETFGNKKLTKKELAEKDEDETDEETDETEEETDEDEDGLTFDQLTAAINKYGNKKPDEMKAILLGFNLKSTKELKQHKNKWAPVYTKVLAKLKAQKKGR